MFVFIFGLNVRFSLITISIRFKSNQVNLISHYPSLGGQKNSYKSSIPIWFINDRVVPEGAQTKQQFVATLQGEKERVSHFNAITWQVRVMCTIWIFIDWQYSTSVIKYDRHGYKKRDRTMVITDKNLCIIEATGSIKIKHKLPLNKLEFIVTSGNDKFVLVKLPEDLFQKNKVSYGLIVLYFLI